MAYSKAKLKSSGDRASPYFSPFWIGKLSEQFLPIRVPVKLARLIKMRLNCTYALLREDFSVLLIPQVLQCKSTILHINIYYTTWSDSRTSASAVSTV
jgi:hypothetical protein